MTNRQASDLKRRQHKLLDETVAFFLTNPRGLENGDHHCVYFAQETKARCAVGRLLPLKVATELGSVASTIRKLLVITYNFSDPTRGAIQKLLDRYNMEFLYNLQQLHDRSDYWTDDGAQRHREGRVRAFHEEIDNGAYLA